MIARTLLRSAAILLVLISVILSAAYALRSPQPYPLLLRYRNAMNMSALLYDPTNASEFPLDQIAIGAPSLLWSPNGQWIVYRDQDGAIAAYNLVTGRNHVISGNQPDTINPLNWSPDSRWLLLYEVNRSDILYVPFDDNGSEAPQKLDVGIYDVLWSPDSTRLYVRDVLKALSVIDTTCLDQHTPCVRSLVPNSRPVEQFAGWMPDGHDLMMISLSESTGRPQIFSLNPDTGTTRLIVAEPLPGAAPVWTPDGKQLAAPLLLAAAPDSEPTGDGIAGVYLIDAATKNQSLIWTGIVGDLSWTPDGNLLAFDLISRVDSRHSVWIYDRTTDRAQNLTPPLSSEVLPAWNRYRGQTLNPAGLAALDGSVLVALWLTRRRRLPSSPRVWRGIKET